MPPTFRRHVTHLIQHTAAGPPSGDLTMLLTLNPSPPDVLEPVAQGDSTPMTADAAFKSDFLRTLRDRGYIHQTTDAAALDRVRSALEVRAYGAVDRPAARDDLDRVLRGERERLIHRVSVQRLRTAEYRGHRLIGHAHDVVHRLLRGERHTCRLRVKAHDPRARILGAVAFLHMPSPDATRRTLVSGLTRQ